MRLIFRFSIPVQKGNEAASDGTLALALKDLVDFRVDVEWGDLPITSTDFADHRGRVTQPM